jgi:uncharacterized protein
LETAQAQFEMFDALPPAEQQRLLGNALAGLPKAKQSIETMVDLWASGDPEPLAAILGEELLGSPALARTLVTDRNRRWAGWVARRMEQPGTVFLAVGALHLAGADSVQAELARRGLKAERIAY